MDREEIIRMAREAGFDMPETVATTDSDWHAREVAGMWKRVDRLIDIAQAAEREACARVCERHADASAGIFAAAIRERGEGK